MDLVAPRVVVLLKRPEYANATVPAACRRFSRKVRPVREQTAVIGTGTDNTLACIPAVGGGVMRNRHAFRTSPAFISFLEATRHMPNLL